MVPILTVTATRGVEVAGSADFESETSLDNRVSLCLTKSNHESQVWSTREHCSNVANSPQRTLWMDN